MTQGEREQNRHNQGQKDYAEDRGYNEPWGGLPSALGLNSENHIAENKAYREGYRHARSQDKK